MPKSRSKRCVARLDALVRISNPGIVAYRNDSGFGSSRLSVTTNFGGSMTGSVGAGVSCEYIQLAASSTTSPTTVGFMKHETSVTCQGCRDKSGGAEPRLRRYETRWQS